MSGAAPAITIDRRRLIAAAAAAGALALPRALRAQTPEGSEFTFDNVVAAARARASEAWEARRLDLPDALAEMGYDAYRDIRFLPERRLWREEDLGFVVDLLPPGSIFADRVNISVVAGGEVRPLAFDPTALDIGERARAAGADFADVGESVTWSGFRLRYPVNRPDVADEVAVFQGASYVRAVGRDQVFGLSARGLAVATASPEGEEFPIFTDFWLKRPEPGAPEMTVWALLDSVSVAGAYEFVVRPGAETVMNVRSVLIPRVEIDEIGVAPLTSMFYFGPRNRERADDYRDAVHDSSGLQMLTGQDERVWRPLTNPRTLEVSYFVDENPSGFGLVQRQRSFAFFQDAEARYEKRPSAWVQPIGDWGPGSVILVEIPTETEFNDNVVAFWRPQEPIPAAQETAFDYRLFWSNQPPDEAPLARVSATRDGRSVNDPALRTLVVDFDLGEAPFEGLEPRAETSAGAIEGVTLIRLPTERGARAAIDFRPPEDGTAELRLGLYDAAGERASETWLFRWSPS